MLVNLRVYDNAICKNIFKIIQASVFVEYKKSKNKNSLTYKSINVLHSTPCEVLALLWAHLTHETSLFSYNHKFSCCFASSVSYTYSFLTHSLSFHSITLISLKVLQILDLPISPLAFLWAHTQQNIKVISFK